MGAALLASACAPASGIPEDIPIGTESRGFLVSVVDSLQDAGRSPSVALDQDGNPVVVYLMLSPVLKTDEIPPAVVAGQPQPPAVMLATEKEGIWSRASVTPQSTSPLMGEAAEIADSKGHAVKGVNTGAAIDGDGARHVVWGTPSGLFYATDSGGEFGEPEEIVTSTVQGAAVALDGSAPWVSYYEGNAVKVIHRDGDSWATEQVATVGSFRRQPAEVTAIAMGPNGQPVVAYGDGGATVVANRSGTGSWVPRSVDGGGGFGLSMDLDADGNPHLAYYDASGRVMHAHSIGGAPFEANELGQAGAPASGQSDPRWGTGIGVTDEGVHYVAYADTADKKVVLVSNDGGSFGPQPLEGAEGGTNPALAVSGDGSKLAVAWFDSTNADLAVAEPAGGPFVIAHSPPAPASASAPPATTGPAQCEPEGTKLEIAAQNIKFDKDCLTAPAGEAFTITFDNQEAVPHNVAIYKGPGAVEPLFQGEIFSGPSSMDYQVDPIPEGIYYFQCDVHGAAMSGQFVAAAT